MPVSTGGGRRPATLDAVTDETLFERQREEIVSGPVYDVGRPRGETMIGPVAGLFADIPHRLWTVTGLSINCNPGTERCDHYVAMVPADFAVAGTTFGPVDVRTMAVTEEEYETLQVGSTVRVRIDIE
mgnify:CR=1 FL=1